MLQPDKIETQIVHALSRFGHLSAAELLKIVNASNRRCTIQGIYGELRKLIALGVCLKQGKNYRLSAMWCLNIVAFARKLEASYLKNIEVSELLPQPGKQKKWHFCTLSQADDFYLHALLVLMQKPEVTQICEWHPLPWFFLLPGDKESEFQRALRVLGKQTNVIVGGRGRLERAYIQSLRHTPHRFSTAVSPFENLRTTSFAVLGDYVVSLRMPQRLSLLLHELFASANSQNDIFGRKVNTVLSQSAALSVVIEHNSKRAGKIFRQFSRFFGLTMKD